MRFVLLQVVSLILVPMQSVLGRMAHGEVALCAAVDSPAMRTEGSEFPRSREFAPRCVMARVESPDEKAFFVGNSMRAGEGSDARPPTTGLARSRQRVSKALLGAAKPCLCVRVVRAGGRWGRGLRDAAAPAAVRLVERSVPGAVGPPAVGSSGGWLGAVPSPRVGELISIVAAWRQASSRYADMWNLQWTAKWTAEWNIFVSGSTGKSLPPRAPAIISPSAPNDARKKSRRNCDGNCDGVTVAGSNRSVRTCEGVH